MAAPVIQFKRGLLANLPGLRAGEPGFTTDAYDLYVGIDSTTNNNQFVGSGRYWSVNTNSVGSGVKLVEGTDNGTNAVTIKSPNSLAASYTLTMPADDGNNGDILTSDGSGNLSFSAPAASNFTLAADSGSDDTFSTGSTLTFAGTANEIETTVSDDQIQIGLPDNVTVGGNLTVTSTLDVNGTDHDIAGAVALDHVTVSGITTVTGQIDGNGGADISGGETTLSSATVSDLTDNRIVVAGSSGALEDDGNLTFDGEVLTVNVRSTLANASVTGVTTTGTLKVGTANAVGITTVLDEDAMTSNSATALATQQSIKAYVDSQTSGLDLEFGTAGDTGTGTVATSQSLTVAGTANEIETVASNQTVTIGLPNDVTVSNNLTVTGNLYVNGSTTQVNTATTTIEDQLLDLGMVDGAVPSSDLNKDIGVLFNYYSGSAKKAAVYWDDSTSRVVVSQDVSESTGVLTNNTGGALEIASLYVNGCSGTTDEVIGCDGNTIVITNATIDGGSF